MESVKLTKPWLEHAIGDAVEVDPLRAKWLKENGYGTRTRKATEELELRPTEPELRSPFPGIEIVEAATELPVSSPPPFRLALDELIDGPDVASSPEEP